VTLKERIIKIFFDGPKLHDPFELRAIGLEVFKLEDRIKRLEEELNYNGLVLQKIQHERDGSNERIKRLEREVEMLRLYGNKDCTAMADEALAKEAKL
jgi:hypothetical protein